MKKIDLQLILRGLAAFWVMYWHFEAAYVNNFLQYVLIPGRTAVWIFFGLSGYVIFHGFQSGKYSLSLLDLKQFYRNRFLRIYPLFLLCSIVILLIKLLKDLALPTLDLHFFLTQILAIQYIHVYELNGVFWTLGIEMWFYLLAPFFYWMLRPVQSMRIAIAIYICLFALSVLEARYLKTPDVRTLTSNLGHFFVGFAAVRFGPALLPKLRLSNAAVLRLAFLTFIFSATCMSIGPRFYGIHLFYTLGAVAVDLGIFLVLLLQPKLELKRTSQAFLKNLLTLGIISYGVYVWHSVVLLAFDIDVQKAGRPMIYGSMLVTLALAWVVYKLYEQRFLSYKRYNSDRIIPA
jgi:peptidoglycan/LPS O-acetylase OafA/YrhL